MCVFFSPLFLSAQVDNAETLVKDVAMQVASMGATSLSYKDFDPAFVASELAARIAIIEKENETLLERIFNPINRSIDFDEH